MQYRQSLVMFSLAGIAALGGAATGAAQQPTAARQHPSRRSALQKEAKITADSAQKIALAQVPNGKVRSHELEREHGKLIYSFDIKIAGKAGVEEVNVNALDGTVVAHEHESAAAEAKEARAEARQKAARSTTRRDSATKKP
ncbi:MAG TPA: PepSY domain-containing protein [Gemmatimonadaceae bacterium]|nr:PepSY domain-containing protein [Gemmatimonadaceae bacterium]